MATEPRRIVPKPRQDCRATREIFNRADCAEGGTMHCAYRSTGRAAVVSDSRNNSELLRSWSLGHETGILGRWKSASRGLVLRRPERLTSPRWRVVCLFFSLSLSRVAFTDFLCLLGSLWFCLRWFLCDESGLPILHWPLSVNFPAAFHDRFQWVSLFFFSFFTWRSYSSRLEYLCAWAYLCGGGWEEREKLCLVLFCWFVSQGARRDHFFVWRQFQVGSGE